MEIVDLYKLLNAPASAIKTAGTVVLNMLAAVLVGVFIYWVYKKTYIGVMYSKNFNVTIMLTSLVTAMIIMVVGTNVVLSLGMLGALSIIRFRSAIKEPRDIGFLFWGISAGLAAGAGAHVIAFVGSSIIALLLFTFMRSAPDVYPYLLVIKGNKIDEKKLETLVKKNTAKYSLRMKNNGAAGIEIIYEVRFGDGQESSLAQQINEMEGVSAVNVVSYKGEIPG